jgi:hypothetical protein
MKEEYPLNLENVHSTWGDAMKFEMRSSRRSVCQGYKWVVVNLVYVAQHAIHCCA